MRQARIGAAALGLVMSLLAVAASCGGTGATGGPAGGHPMTSSTSTATSATSATASATAAPEPSAPKATKIASWLDDVVVQGLAKDCRWDPHDCVAAINAIAPRSSQGIAFRQDDSPPAPGEPEAVAQSCTEVMALACAATAEQSCVPDECSHTDEECIPACDTTCSGCSAKCVTGCETCKSACKDDACRLACGRSCGECHQSCLKALDHCATAGCSEKQEACSGSKDGRKST